MTESHLINSIVDELASQGSDAVARDHLARTAEARVAFKNSGNALDRRRSLAPEIITVFRTDADPRTVDLSLDPSERPYGSLFGRRPDLINYGLTGFGRLTTPEAWLSTWSGLSPNADFVRCAPGVTAPTLFIGLTGDQAAFPADSSRMTGALGAEDLTTATVRGLHFGGPIADGQPAGNELAGWSGAHHVRVEQDARAALFPELHWLGAVHSGAREPEPFQPLPQGGTGFAVDREFRERDARQARRRDEWPWLVCQPGPPRLPGL